MRILIVDDEQQVCSVLQNYFVLKGHEVACAQNTEEALQLASDQFFQAALVDIVLGYNDGLELLARLKHEHPNFPVIMMTGLGYDEDLLQEAKMKGASGYVSKVLPLSQLLMEVHRAVYHQIPKQ